MRALVISRNLLGDGLWIGPAISEGYSKHPDVDDITLLTHDDYIKVIYERMSVPLRVVTDPAIEQEEFDFRYNSRVRLGVDDTARTDRALKGIVGKRLTYRSASGNRPAPITPYAGP